MGKINTNFQTPKELEELKNKQQKELIVKTLFAAASLAAGVAMLILLGPFFAPVGAALMIISTVAMYQYYNHYVGMRNIYLQAKSALKSMDRPKYFITDRGSSSQRPE